MDCPACGTSVPAEARFCPACGQVLISRPDERRLATVVFADLVGFTTFSESADPEHVKDLVDTCFESLGADVRAYGGQVDKIVGDALVALFGAPLAHEDDAERAVRCALQMQQTLAEVRERHELRVELRIGVNTGEVLVGAMRSGGDYTAMGDVVNTASRLEQTADPGCVVVGPSTYAATRDAIRYESLGAIVVRGREEPVEAWIAREPVARPGNRRRRARAPLVGRDAEVTLLQGVVDAALARERAHLVLLTGDAGVGKSRLAGEIAAHATSVRGAKVLTGQCVPYGEDVWWPIAEAIREVCDVPVDASHDDARVLVCQRVAEAMGRAEDDAEVSRIARGLLYLLGFQTELNDVDPTRARDDALRSARALFGHVAQKQPLVLVLSDLHWADELVLDLVERLLDWLRGGAFVLVATARPELRERWQPAPGRHDLTILNLDPLRAEAVTRLVQGLLGAEATPELVALLHERSGGNPFFIEELAALIRDAGAESAVRSGRLPATLQGLVAARLDGLSVPERNVLEDCAVVGTSGSIEAVRALTEARGDPIGSRTVLDQLADRELIDVTADEFTFPSEVVRQVAYATLTKGERARRHALLGEIFTERLQRDDSPAALDRVAHHYGAAAELLAELGQVPGIPVDLTERAISVLERAGDRARSAETWRSASRLYDQALALHDPSAPIETRWRLLLGRGRALAEQRHLPAAREDVEEVLEGAATDPLATARAMTLLADIEQMEGQHDQSLATFDRAISMWRDLGDERGVGEALRRRGITAMFLGDLDGADEQIGEALEVLRRIGDRRGEAWALQNLATISFFRGDTGPAEQRLAAAGEMFRDLGDWGGLNWSFAILGWVRFMQGRLDEAEELAVEQLPESESSGNRWVSGILSVLLGNVSLWTGRPVAALEHARGAVARFRDIGDHWGETQGRVVLVRSLAAAGRIDEALAELEGGNNNADPTFVTADGIRSLVRTQVLVHIGDNEALPSALHISALGEGQLNTEMRMMLGMASIQAGRLDEGIAELEAARRAIPDPDAGPGAALRTALALGLAAAGRTADARALADAGIEAGTYLDRQGCELAAAFTRLQAGDTDGAVAAFDAALARIDATEAKLDQAIVRLARTRAFAALGRADAADVEAETTAVLAALGHDLPGWDRLFSRAAGQRA
ncbi:MAG: adenylate/guanylate cyclase domain-containing protein [Acidimicrobiia bacterium]